MATAEETFAGARVRHLRREEYEKLVELGAFADERVELLFGRIVEMPPQGPPHDDTVARLTRALVRACGDEGDVRPQCSFRGPESVPIPDLAVVPPGDYSKVHPSAAYLIVEVAESSLRTDRGPKATLYAQAGVPEYWVVNLVDRVVEVSTEPLGDHYARVQPYRGGDRIRLAELPGVEIAVDDVLPRA